MSQVLDGNVRRSIRRWRIVIRCGRIGDGGSRSRHVLARRATCLPESLLLLLLLLRRRHTVNVQSRVPPGVYYVLHSDLKVVAAADSPQPARVVP